MSEIIRKNRHNKKNYVDKGKNKKKKEPSWSGWILIKCQQS